LTGLLNRRAFVDHFAAARRRRAADQGPTAMLVLDLDHFKSINDRHGHDAGDRMLRHFAEIARRSIRPPDLLFRMGGEEFCAVLPDTGAQQARSTAERLRRAYAESPVLIDGAPVFGTVSIGVAADEGEGADPSLLLASADAALYAAKARGRNQTALAEAAPSSRKAPELTAALA
jgi:diguanylate cyclase (GGDEF)-like protein